MGMKLFSKIAAAGIAAFALAYTLNAVISRMPFFRWAVLGIGKERA